jgi:uncharacterized protein (UPF0335 family)
MFIGLGVVLAVIAVILVATGVIGADEEEPVVSRSVSDSAQKLTEAQFESQLESLDAEAAEVRDDIANILQSADSATADVAKIAALQKRVQRVEAGLRDLAVRAPDEDRAEEARSEAEELREYIFTLERLRIEADQRADEAPPR